MSQALFGSGLAVLTPNLSGTVTPTVVGVLQDISVDISAKTVDLIGNLQVAVDKAKAEVKWSGKFKTGYFAGGLIQAILAGSTSAVGNNMAILNEAWAIPSTPYQVTVAQSSKWVADLGVFDVTANKFLTCVASGPVTGQYAVSAGVYTFAAADTTHNVQITYSYSSTTQGTTINYTNQVMGTNTTFGFRLFNNYQTNSAMANSAPGAGIYLPVVTIPKLSLAFKNTGFMEKSMDFEASAAASGAVATIWTGN
jgi:hypothetical protein